MLGYGTLQSSTSEDLCNVNLILVSNDELNDSLYYNIFNRYALNLFLKLNNHYLAGSPFLPDSSSILLRDFFKSFIILNEPAELW